MLKKIILLSFISYCFFGLFYNSTCLSQPTEKFFILNLNWNNNTIRLNAFHVAEGMLKARRVIPNGNHFFYRVLSRNQTVLDQNYFEVPRILHFDCAHDGSEGVGGGSFERPAVDFILKIPAREHSSRILFYRLKDRYHTPLFSTTRVKETQGEMVGEISLP